MGYSSLDHQGMGQNSTTTTGFSHCFHLPGCHFGYLFLTHSHRSQKKDTPKRNISKASHATMTDRMTYIEQRMGDSFDKHSQEKPWARLKGSHVFVSFWRGCFVEGVLEKPRAPLEGRCFVEFFVLAKGARTVVLSISFRWDSSLPGGQVVDGGFDVFRG